MALSVGPLHQIRLVFLLLCSIHAFIAPLPLPQRVHLLNTIRKCRAILPDALTSSKL